MLEFLRAIPPPVLVPILILFAGIGDLMKVLVIVSGCVWPVLLNTVEGVRGRRRGARRHLPQLRIRGVARLRHLVLRSASPQIVTGARQALSIGIILMVISEMFAASSGLGFTVVQFQRGFQIPEMWSGVLLLGLLGVAAVAGCSGWSSAGSWAGTTACAPPSADRVGVRRCWRSSGLRKVYDGARPPGRGDRRPHLRRRRTAQFVCVVGPSGCGKTTLLRCIAGLLPPTAGEVAVDGTPVTGPPHGLAVVFQEYGRSLFPWLRVRENVELPLRGQAAAARASGATLVDEALAAVGLGRRATPPTRGSSPAACSSGSRSPAPSPTSRGCC